MGDDDKQYVKELLRKAPKTYERRKSYVNSVGDIYSIDLADMSMYVFTPKQRNSFSLLYH